MARKRAGIQLRSSPRDLRAGAFIRIGSSEACIASGIGKVSIMDISKALVPFLAASLIVLGLVTYVPQVTLFLPNLLLGK